MPCCWHQLHKDTPTRSRWMQLTHSPSRSLKRVACAPTHALGLVPCLLAVLQETLPLLRRHSRLPPRPPVVFVGDLLVDVLRLLAQLLRVRHLVLEAMDLLRRSILSPELPRLVVALR